MTSRMVFEEIFILKKEGREEFELLQEERAVESTIGLEEEWKYAMNNATYIEYSPL